MSTLATLANVLPALATITDGATVARRGKRIRLTRSEHRMSHMSTQVLAALDALVTAGCTVRVYSRRKIHTLLGPATATTRSACLTRGKVMVEVVI